jgi:hypothetical protein
MAFLTFVNDIFPILFIAFGFVGVFFGFNRILKKDDEESVLLKLVGAISGILIFATIIIVLLNDGSDITKYSVFFAFLYFLSTLARPLKKIPVAFILATIFGLAVFYFVMGTVEEVTFFQNIPMQYILIGIAAIVILFFIIGFVQEKVMDAFLFVWSWGGVIFTLGLILVIQGITLLIAWPNEDGFLHYLPG